MSRPLYIGTSTVVDVLMLVPNNEGETGPRGETNWNSNHKHPRRSSVEAARIALDNLRGSYEKLRLDVRSKYAHLLDTESVASWYQKLKKGSEYTAMVYLSRLGTLCDLFDEDPMSLLQKDTKVVREKLDRFISAMLDTTKENGEHYSMGYLDSYGKAINSWWKHNYVAFRIPKLPGTELSPTLENEKSPLNEELHRVIYDPRTSLRTRVSIAQIAFCSPRPGTQGNKRGTDGIRLSDLPELEIQTDENGNQRNVSFLHVPTMIIIRTPLSKSRSQYFVFMGEEGVELVRAYLDARIMQGETLGPNSALVSKTPLGKARTRSFGGRESITDFLTTGAIYKDIKEAFRNCGFGWRPYILRTYFAYKMMVAEAKGLIIRDYKSFLMGHKGTIEHKYTLAKHQLPDELVDSLRRSYERASLELETRPLVAPAPNIVNSVPSTSATADQRLERNVRVQRKIFALNDIEAALNEGWEHHANLPDGRIIMEKTGA